MWKKQGKFFFEHHSQVPVVDTEYEDRWRIFYSTRDHMGRSLASYVDVEKENPFNIISRSSFPILDLGKPGSFDVDGIMPTCILNFNGMKYLYYIGWTQRKDIPYHNSIGLAVSTDGGKSFEKKFDGPLFSPSPEEPYYCGTFYVLREKNYLRGYYLSCTGWYKNGERLEPKYDIKYAESKDGIRWDRKNFSCVSLASHEGGISQASVVKSSRGYEMWYSYRGKYNFRKKSKDSYAIGYATSNDGKAWTRHDDKISFDSNDEYCTWDDQMMCYPCVITSAKKRYMFYNGNGFGKSGIGFAVDYL